MIDYFDSDAVQRQYVADEKRKTWKKSWKKSREATEKRIILNLSEMMDTQTIAEALEMDPDYVSSILIKARKNQK